MAARMEATVSMKMNNWLAACSAVLYFLSSTVAVGAEVEAGIVAGVSYTDNVFLDTSPGEVDDLIYQASPYVSVVHETPNLDVNIDYAFDWYRYSDLSESSRYHRGEISLTGKAWGDSLLTEIGASRSQALSNPDDVIPVGRLPFSGNLTDADEWWFNPSLNRELGRNTSLQADYRYSRLQFSDSGIQDVASQAGTFGLDNYRSAQGLAWALKYNWRRAEFDVTDPWEFQQALAELGYWINSSTRIFVGGGQESSWDNPFDPKLEETIWEAGFAHRQGENLTLEIAAGERSFGSSWRGDLEYTFRRGRTSVSYSEVPTTTGFADLRMLRNPFDPDGLNDFLNRPGEADRYVSNRFQWDLGLDFRRTGLNLAVFDEERTDRTSAAGTTVDDQSQRGVRLSLNWQVGVRTDVSVDGARVEQERGADRKSRLNSAGLTANYQLGQRTDVSLRYSFTEQRPRGPEPLGRKYTANVVSLLFTITI